MGEERQGRERQGWSTRNDKSHSAEAVAVLRQYSHRLARLGAWFAASSLNIPQTAGNLKGMCGFTQTVCKDIALYKTKTNKWKNKLWLPTLPPLMIMMGLKIHIYSDCCKPKSFSTGSPTGPPSLQGVHKEAVLVSRLETAYMKQEISANICAVCIKTRKITVIITLSGKQTEWVYYKTAVWQVKHCSGCPLWIKQK